MLPYGITGVTSAMRNAKPSTGDNQWYAVWLAILWQDMQCKESTAAA